jgi:hypothetical protein
VGFSGVGVRGKDRRIVAVGATRGQALLEAALVLPLMVVVVLGILQLTEIEQARIMTEYAAFSAARAGIVWSGSNERMRDAAMVALLPTFGRTDSLPAIAATMSALRSRDEAFLSLPWQAPIPHDINGAPLNGVVRVDTINPQGGDELAQIWNAKGGADWKELDFDGAYTYPEHPALSRHFDTFDELPGSDDSQEPYRKAQVLSIRVRYWYELRIPIANWFVFAAWYAANAHLALRGALDRPTLGARANAVNRTSDLSGLEQRTMGIANEKGFPTAYRSEMDLLWRIASGWQGIGAERGRRFFIPISATHSMRMQSNFYRKWLMHPSGVGG